MNDVKEPVDDVPTFLAHAIAMEDESAERYEMLRDTMEVHHNDEVAQLFDQLMGYSETHADEVRARATGISLPDIPPWAFSWNCPDYPEGGDCLSEDISYLMTPLQALNIALHNEAQGRDFYVWVAESSADGEVRRLANEMAEEEQEHVDLLKEWIANADLSEEAPQEDLDPPNTPE